MPRTVRHGTYFTSIDDKSGFDNVRLSPLSYKLVGFQWAGYYFSFRTLPFGFKLSSYIYHTLNLQPMIYIRAQFHIPSWLYIDDRLLEQVRHESGVNHEGKPIKTSRSQQMSDYDSAKLSNYITCELLLRLGYCLYLTEVNIRSYANTNILGFYSGLNGAMFQNYPIKEEYVHYFEGAYFDQKCDFCIGFTEICW